MRLGLGIARVGAAICGMLATPFAAAQEIIVRPRPAYGVTVIEEPPPAVVVRPPPTIRYYAPPPQYVYTEDGCHWLRRRALATGDPYWWSRYDDCVED
ncbi:MAG TPA: hypothetical protein VFA64_05270 [Hyphomicrobiaceae bacterium]|nr:hypothetical protein [Hyphomicrobiaceae bacterium]